MITLHKYEGKSIQIVEELCEKELEESKENIFYITYEQENGLFKSKKVILEAITKKEIIEYIKNYIKELSNIMNININNEVRIDEENKIISVLLVSDNNNIIIGYNGKTLDSIQLILRQNLKELSKFGFKIIVDVSNYKAKRVKNLEFEIKKICKEILKSKVEVKLDPMNSYERRIVHSIVSEFQDLQSVSTGEEPNRYTVIRLKDE